MKPRALFLVLSEAVNYVCVLKMQWWMFMSQCCFCDKLIDKEIDLRLVYDVENKWCY